LNYKQELQTSLANARLTRTILLLPYHPDWL